MRIPSLIAAALLAIPLLSLHAEEGFQSIFNGKDLEGWAAPEGNIWWLAEDGILQVRSGPEKKGSIL